MNHTTPGQFIQKAVSLSEDAGLDPDANIKLRTDALVDQMRKSGLLAVCVSKLLGGPELGVRDIAAITYEIAKQSGSAGLIYAMHMSQALSICNHSRGDWHKALQQRMVTKQLLFASGTSEVGPEGDILTSICQVELLDGDRRRVEKSTPNMSYVDHADFVLVTANYASAKVRSKQVLIAAELDRNNFIPGRATDLLGMRGIYNRPYTFVIEFDEQAIFSCDFGVIARETMTPSIQIFWAAVWSGIAWSALSKLKRFVIKEISRDKGLTGPMQHGLTELVSKHYMINSMVRDVIGTYEEAGDSAGMGFGLSAKLNRVKVKCSELAREICLGALGIIGIRGYALSGPYSVAEEVTDILSGEIMVSNYRLSMNTAKIERFVDENLFPTVHQVTHGRE